MNIQELRCQHHDPLARQSTSCRNECRIADHRGTARGTAPRGQCLSGQQPGPSALIAGQPDVIRALLERLQTLHDVPWLWGKLYLVEIDGDHPQDFASMASCLADTMFDDLVYIPRITDPHSPHTAADQPYTTALTLCRQLGMIRDQGVG